MGIESMTLKKQKTEQIHLILTLTMMDWTMEMNLRPILIHLILIQMTMDLPIVMKSENKPTRLIPIPMVTE